MNVEIRTEAAQLPEKEYINRIFLAEHTPAGAKSEAGGEEGAVGSATMAAGAAGSGLAPSQRNIVIVGRIFYPFFQRKPRLSKESSVAVNSLIVNFCASKQMLSSLVHTVII
jgi:hypothetical protein